MTLEGVFACESLSLGYAAYAGRHCTTEPRTMAHVCFLVTLQVFYPFEGKRCATFDFAFVTALIVIVVRVYFLVALQVFFLFETRGFAAFDFAFVTALIVVFVRGTPSPQSAISSRWT